MNPLRPASSTQQGRPLEPIELVLQRSGERIQRDVTQPGDRSIRRIRHKDTSVRELGDASHNAAAMGESRGAV